MTSTISTTTVVTATVGTAATLALAYAVYFDHRRRHDPEFRKALKREARRSAKAQRQEAAASKAEERKRIKQVVADMEASGIPTPDTDMERFFLDEVSQGEAMCNDDHFAAAACFYRAMKVYPQPKEMMGVYDRTVPKPVLDILAEIIAADPKLVAKTSGSTSGSEHGSIVNVE
jgi:import receptor subunit TOM20